ncbi:MAG: HD domain-containing protein [Pseudomonadota bacterium]
MIDLRDIKKHLNDREEKNLSPHATLSRDALRRAPDPRIEEGHRQEFSVDSDRILHSAAYTRYIDKTQVFSLVDNDQITHRVLHVQLVSKISRTIGRFLGLNEDLIEAIALGHDIGHSPFGHDGETYLSKLCVAHGIGPFQHNLQSVRFLEKIERQGKGWNLSLQVLDGIMCHDGEVHSDRLQAIHKKTFEMFDRELLEKYTNPDLDLVPMTLEGCVVRIADTISYIGRDIEDAILLGLIKRADIPRDVVARLGDANGTIVYKLVEDVIENSFQQPYAAFSQEVSEVVKKLKEFNLKYIYLNSKIRPDSGKIEHLFKVLFEQYLSGLEKQRADSKIFRRFLDNMDDFYSANTSNPEIARDYIAGMTDEYFLKECNKLLFPRRLGSEF